MIYGVYAIKDTKTGWLPPQVDQNDASAMRNFEHATMQKDSLFYSHGSDYELYNIGYYDTEDGSFTSTEKKHLMNGMNKE